MARRLPNEPAIVEVDSDGDSFAVLFGSTVFLADFPASGFSVVDGGGTATLSLGTQASPTQLNYLLSRSISDPATWHLAGHPFAPVTSGPITFV